MRHAAGGWCHTLVTLLLVADSGVASSSTAGGDDAGAGSSTTGGDDACVEPGSFVAIDFTNARLARSNLGAVGGRCDSADGGCSEVRNVSHTPSELLYHGVGVHGADAARIDLRVTNVSEYRAVSRPRLELGICR